MSDRNQQTIKVERARFETINLNRVKTPEEKAAHSKLIAGIKETHAKTRAFVRDRFTQDAKILWMDKKRPAV